MNSVLLLRFKILDKKKGNTDNEVAKCLKTLNALVGEQETMKIKSELIANISYEIRTNRFR